MRRTRVRGVRFGGVSRTPGPLVGAPACPPDASWRGTECSCSRTELKFPASTAGPCRRLRGGRARTTGGRSCRPSMRIWRASCSAGSARACSRCVAVGAVALVPRVRSAPSLTWPRGPTRPRAGAGRQRGDARPPARADGLHTRPGAFDHHVSLSPAGLRSPCSTRAREAPFEKLSAAQVAAPAATPPRDEVCQPCGPASCVAASSRQIRPPTPACALRTGSISRTRAMTRNTSQVTRWRPTMGGQAANQPAAGELAKCQ